VRARFGRASGTSTDSALYTCLTWPMLRHWEFSSHIACQRAWTAPSRRQLLAQKLEEQKRAAGGIVAPPEPQPPSLAELKSVDELLDFIQAGDGLA